MSLEASARENDPILETRDIDEIVRAAGRSVGLAYPRTGIHKQLTNLLNSSVASGRTYRAITYGLTVVIAILPFLVSQLLSHVQGQPAKTLLWVVFISAWILLLLLNLFFPKDVAEYALRAEMIRARWVINRLAGQLALHNFIQNICSEDDEATIAEVSRALDEPAAAALSARQEAIIRILSNRSDSWGDTEISFANSSLGGTLNARLADIAESVSNACCQIFGSSHFTVKIYLKTSHVLPVDGKMYKVELLTAVARYPRKRRVAVGAQGTSWMNCRGSRADVWHCLEEGRPKVYQRVKSAKANKTYPAIACVPLSDGLGVVTIESDDPHIFSHDHKIADIEREISVSEERIPLADHNVSSDVHKSLAVSVKDLVLKALRADVTLRSQGNA